MGELNCHKGENSIALEQSKRKSDGQRLFLTWGIPSIGASAAQRRCLEGTDREVREIGGDESEKKLSQPMQTNVLGWSFFVVVVFVKRTCVSVASRTISAQYIYVLFRFVVFVSQHIKTMTFSATP